MNIKIINALNEIYQNYKIISFKKIDQDYLVKILPDHEKYYLMVSVGKNNEKNLYYVWNAMQVDIE